MIERWSFWLVEQGVPEGIAGWLSWLGVAVALALLAVVANFVAKGALMTTVRYFVRKTPTKWDDALMRRHVFTRLSHLAPALVIYYGAVLFGTTPALVIQRLAVAYILLAGLYTLFAFLSAVADIYETFDVSKRKPIKSYIQIVKIVAAVLVGLITLATLLNQEVGWLLGGFGAMTAVVLLVFKDSILGLVASIQLSANDMVRIGDWVEMPKYGADGDVIDVSLNTVKIRNWDKTISTIPAYALISDSFKNWRGMSESGGRRIKRSINIDIGSIRFCSEEMLDRYQKYHLITDYVKSRRKEIAEYNREHDVDTALLVNGRSMTNVGTFRAYAVAYLRSHPKIHQAMTFLLRQLPPGEHGLPLEVYVFCNDQEWASYEAIQADIFDHFLAAIPTFDLRVFQRPSGSDLRRLTSDAVLPDSRA